MSHRVMGIGGVFFKARDPETLLAWYRDVLGLPIEDHPSTMFVAEKGDGTVWGLFPPETDYFAPSQQPFMLNFRVADLDASLAHLREHGAEIVGDVEEYEYGRFGWVMDPEGNKLELWQPAAAS